jgi:hypothetical protein
MNSREANSPTRVQFQDIPHALGLQQRSRWTILIFLIYAIGCIALIGLGALQSFKWSIEEDGPNRCDMTYMYPNYFPIKFENNENLSESR